MTYAIDQFLSAHLTIVLALVAVAALTAVLVLVGKLRAANRRLSIQRDFAERRQDHIDELEKEKSALLKERAALSRDIDYQRQSMATLTERSAEEVRSLQKMMATLKKRCPDALIPQGKGIYDRSEVLTVSGTQITKIHFRNGAHCTLPVVYAPPPHVTPGMRIEVSYNPRSMEVHVEPLTKTATLGGRLIPEYLSVVK